MARIIEADDDGYVHLPPDALGDRRPRAQYEVEREDDVIHLRLAHEHKQTRDKEEAREWVRGFRRWMKELTPRSVVLPDEALHRESFYD